MTALSPDATCKFHIPSQPIYKTNLATCLVSMTLYSGLNSPEWLTGLREILYLRLPLYYKGCNLETSRWNRSVRQRMQVGVNRASMCPLGLPPSQNIDVFTNPEALWTLSSKGFLWRFHCWGCRGGSDGKESACNAADPGSVLELGRSPGEGNGNPLQYSCLEKSMDRGAWWATVRGVTKRQTRLRDGHTHTGMINWIIGHWWLNFHLPLSSLSLFSRSGGGTESSKPLTGLWSFWGPASVLKLSGLLPSLCLLHTHTRSHLISTQR